MKHCYLTLLLFIALHNIADATQLWWTGPQNGNWSDPANWSINGVNGIRVPADLDTVSFTYRAAASLIHVDQTVTVGAMFIQSNITLYASTPVTFFISQALQISAKTVLKDSTSENVPFNMILRGPTGTKAYIYGAWVFEGRVPVNRLYAGATFVAEPGSEVNIPGIYNSTTLVYDDGGQIIFKANAGTIVSDKTSLRFGINANFVLDNSTDALIPSALWAVDMQIIGAHMSTQTIKSSTILIKNNIGKLAYSDTPSLAKMVVDLPGLSSDASLNLPNLTSILGNLEILNTNGHTLTLLSSTSTSSFVSVYIGSGFNNGSEGGYLKISGSNTKVALATATAGTAGKNYRLTAGNGFAQTGGNFSLQDFNGATGSTTLGVRGGINQAGGTFNTNSTSTAARFAIEMTDPVRSNATPEIYFNYQSASSIYMSTGSIDNAAHNIILRIDHGVYTNVPPSPISPNGVILNSPLSVGRLELVRSPLTTTAANILTVNNPAPDAIVLGGISSSGSDVLNGQNTSTSYVNGPLRRATNSATPYLFPTGKGNKYQSTADYNNYRNSFHNDSCYITPVAGTPSMYQAEYFETGYPDSNVTAPLAGVSITKYWNVSKLSGADATLQLLLHQALPGAKATDGIVTATYDGTWKAANGTVLSPGNVASGTVSSKPFSIGGLYTFGYGDGATLNPVTGTVFNGLHYKYYEGGYLVMPDFNTLTPIKTGNSADFDLNIRRSGVNDSFAIVWEGYINIPAAGSYTFQTVSDDGSKFYFNSLYNPNAVALVNNDSTHAARTASGTINVAAPGRYPVTVTYFENVEREQLQVYWEGPGIPKQLIPPSAFTDAVIQPVSGGLNYQYYEGTFNMLADLAGKTPVKTGVSANVDISVRPPLVNDNFAFVWEGKIIIPTGGLYTFETNSDDGSSLVINGVTVVNNDGLHASTAVTGSLTLAAGTYPIRISYFERDGGENMQVYWSGPGIVRQLIPDAAFSGAAPPVTSGLSYKYYEGNFDLLPDFNNLTPVRTGTSANADISVRPAGVNDHFAFVWQGTISIPAAGLYTFETISDDGSKIYFNIPYSASATGLVNNDGLHAPVSATGNVNITAPGSYPITITYFEKDGGETMQLYWTGPGFGRQLIPDAAFRPATPPVSNQGGLNYKYYEGDFNALPDYSSLVPVKTGTSNNVDISVRTPGVNDHFAFVWSGYISLPTAGTYTFETVSDDGSKVYFNIPYSMSGTGTVNNDGLHAPVSATGTVSVAAAGKYPITVTFFEKDGGETMQLFWTGPGISRQLIPDAAFTTTDNLNGNVLMSDVQHNYLRVEQDQSKAARVYPNPFVESFVVDYYYYAGNSNKVNIGLYDVNGKLVFSYQPAHLTVGYNRWVIKPGTKNLKTGVYIAQVKVNGIVEKIIKIVKVE